MLEVRNVDVSYGDIQALWDVSLTARDEEIVALVGSNGAGKTTVLKTITGVLKPTKGSVTFMEFGPTRSPPIRSSTWESPWFPRGGDFSVT